jgi:bifunctional DNase/RNase
MTTTDTPIPVELEIDDVRRRTIDGQEQYVVVLQAATGERLPIWIGPSESIALAVRLTDTPTPRPLTYETMASLLAAVDGRITEILITKVEDGVFYADAVVEGAGGSARVDLRPSDALNLALVTGAPIRASAQALTDGLQTERADVTSLEDFPDDAAPSRRIFADSGRCSSGTPRIPRRSYAHVPERAASFDLLISLYAGFVSEACGWLLRPGGLLLANDSHGDASLAALDPGFELVGAFTRRDRLRTDELDTYLQPKSGRTTTTDDLRRTGRGVAVTRDAKAYLFRRRPGDRAAPTAPTRDGHVG